MVIQSEEVREALARGAPVVALETSVVAQGLPSPHGRQAALDCEQAVRASGAIPATIGVVEGVVKVGLSVEDIERLAAPNARLAKIGSRDLAAAVAGRLTGGTTVSATCEVAARAGIRLFATGGIGGVHRGASDTWDVSQDLWTLSRFPVAVVCAGAKSVLDLPKTLEALETLGVPVVGYRTSELPAFYSERSGLVLEHRVESAVEGASFIRARLDLLAQGGLVLAQPPPAASSLSDGEVQLHLTEALAAAEREGVRGKAVTPFLLSFLASATGGRALQANLALLRSNAALAAEIAVKLAAS